jgi:two-component system, OmpR family, KDP operon response regulator KdpE
MEEGIFQILIVDDEPSIRKFLRVILVSQKYSVIEAATAEEALSKLTSQKPDAIILDLGLPDIDGIEVTCIIRQWTKIPILVLSVRGSESDKISALDAGADDYVTKPFSTGELLARLRAALRRKSNINEEPIFVYGPLTVDLGMHRVTLGDREIQLTPTEYNLLRMLITNAGKLLTHHQLLRDVWGAGYEADIHILHVNISNLRKKIDLDISNPLIITESGIGYRFKNE